MSDHDILSPPEVVPFDGWYSNDAATFGDRVAAGRESLGLSQQDLFAAGANADLCGLIIQPVFPLELGTDRLFQLDDAIGRGVFGFAIRNRLHGGVLDVLRGVEIWLPTSWRRRSRPRPNG